MLETTSDVVNDARRRIAIAARPSGAWPAAAGMTGWPRRSPVRRGPAVQDARSARRSARGLSRTGWLAVLSCVLLVPGLPAQGAPPPPPTRARRAPHAVAKPAAAKPIVAQPIWPVAGPEQLPGAILPSHRIVAFYGNPLSKGMGILGALPPEQMLAKLDTEVAAWQAIDPATPVIPALQLIVSTAQPIPGRDGMYRARMPDTLIDRVSSWADQRNALLFLDVQVGHSTVAAELQRLLPYLARPTVHLALDPEFSMKDGSAPGKRIGTMDASDVNEAVRVLDSLVTADHLPPKVLVVHRFTRPMLTNAKRIRLDPKVQIVVDMDGWGPRALKEDSYHAYVYGEPVQFTGFKLFYHNDTKSGRPLMTPAEVLRLYPAPLYIQYQ
jgi:hypothetical protein